MNTRHMIAAAALALTGVAASASPTVFTDMPSTMSRAEVQAQVEQARAEGLFLRHNDAYGAGDARNIDGSATASLTTRAAVLAELVQARRSGEFDARGELYGDLVWTQFGNIGQPLPDQASDVAANALAVEPAAVAPALTSRYQPAAADLPNASSLEPVVLWVPLDGEAITLQPGDAVMLVPADQVIAVPDAE